MDIYTLNDPRDNSIRYVGITRETERRKYGHRSSKSKSNPKKRQWVSELQAQGMQPVLTVIDQANTETEARAREQYWIKIYRERGCQLFNIAGIGVQPIDESDTPLKRIRQKLGASQEGVARRTRSVSTGTVKNAENGKRVTFDTATQILEAINGMLEEAGKSRVTLDDLGLTLY